jgi:hypothetical protein
MHSVCKKQRGNEPDPEQDQLSAAVNTRIGVARVGKARTKQARD